MRVLVESGYDRTANSVETGVNFIVAIPTGIDDGAQEVANIRPFGTAPVDQRSPYGVGGPPVNTGSFNSNSVPVSAAAVSTPNVVPTLKTVSPAAQPAVRTSWGSHRLFASVELNGVNQIAHRPAVEEPAGVVGEQIGDQAVLC